MNTFEHPKDQRVDIPLLAIASGLMSAGALMLVPSASFATQYSLSYGVDAKYRYNDNIGLRPDNELDVHGAELALPAKLTISDQRYNAYVDGEISSTKYDESGYNSDDQKLQLGGDYNYERGTISGVAGIVRSSTTETAFLDNGVVGASADRVERYNAGLSGLYYVTEANALISGLQYNQNDYEADRLVDNKSIGGYLGLSHQYSETTSLQVRTVASRFENDAVVGVESDGLSLQAGFNTAFTENLSLSLLLGYSEVSTEYDAPSGFPSRDDDDTSGWRVNSSAEYVTERSSLRGSFNRQESASPDGYLIVSNRLTAAYELKVTERMRLTLETIAGSNGALDEDINNDRDYVEGHVSLKYRIAESWYLSTKYTHRYQDRERATGDASANLFIASIRYQPNQLTWSR